MTDKPQILAVVDGRELTEADLAMFMQNMNPQVIRHFPGEEGKKRILDEMINQELLYIEAIEQGLEKDKTFMQTLEATKESLLKSYAFAKLLESIDVTEEEAKQYFEENKEQFGEEEAVEAAHILVSTEEEAEKLFAEIEAGKDFEELAKEFSTCPSSEAGGALGKFGRGMMVPEFEVVAFAMSEGEVSKPIKTQFGFHLIKLLKKFEAFIPDWDKAKENVFVEARRIKQQKLYMEHMEELKKLHPVVYK
ncbi:MAG: foldase [Tissierellia bacterium]|nr:foldase [Tissierellia bacterium]